MSNSHCQYLYFASRFELPSKYILPQAFHNLNCNLWPKIRYQQSLKINKNQKR